MATPSPLTRRAVRALWISFVATVVAPAAVAANAVTAWNASAGRAALAACIAPADDPLHESRMYAMAHVAMHDALNAIERRSRPYAYSAAAGPGVSADAAVAAAARDVLVATIAQIPAPFPPACLEAGIASVEADYATALAAIPPGAAKTRGIKLGRAAAAAILARRAGDGSDTPLLDFGFPQGTAPGEWRFTEPPFAFAPGWGDVTPFVLRQARQFRPPPPFSVTSRRYTADFEEVKRLGGDGTTTPTARTSEQTQIALFWRESSPLMWNRIARDLADRNGLDLWASARLFGLLNLALADGYIASWRTKFDYLFWRPLTAIRMADTDGNPDTDADPTWTALQQPTYPMPDYDSAHSVQGGAAAEVLRRVFGTDDVPFAICSLSLPGSSCADAVPIFRSFVRFSQAAAENGESRVLVGIHFRLATEMGIRHGRKIGALAVLTLMRPVE